MRIFLLAGLALIVSGCSDDPAATFQVKGASTAAASRMVVSDYLLSAIPGRSSGTPTSFKITFYAAYVSASTDCSNPILLQDFGAAGTQVDMTTGATLFAGSPPNGTYPCLILKFNDNMKFKADATAVAAHAGCTSTSSEYTFDIYRDGESDDGAWIDMNGVGVNATGSAASPGGDQVYVFASTVNGVAKANGVLAHANQSGDLSSPLVVPGQSTYYWDATNGIDNHSSSGSNYCWIENVSSGFR